MSKKIRNKRDRFLKKKEKQRERAMKRQFGSRNKRREEEY